jgi:hypothetical protein
MSNVKGTEINDPGYDSVLGSGTNDTWGLSYGGVALHT